ncbi:unnamed protein product [Psylliodes chrysocephalus]|uniref:Uncharacterized protein n=1 Tax=Psylliodes chrysocephalus TaxID=3402493 RepID=A0A9P0CQI7_9CUCU|nr:unnamed protein product [Psylliodes chrysocephala]
MKSKFIFVILLLITFKGKELNGLRCYVCSDDGTVPCLNFDSEKGKFIQQCDRSQKGCFLKIEGNNKTRSCVDKKLDDCKMANEVEYCFCSSELCNTSTNKLSDITDDEDLIEGSGTKIAFDNTKVTENNHKPKQNTTVVLVRSSDVRNVVCLYLAYFLVTSTLLF